MIVWGSCFWASRLRLRPPPPSFTRPSLSHTIFHTPSLSSHTHLSHTLFVTHPLCHTTLSHTFFHQPSFTPLFVTHHLSHTLVPLGDIHFRFAWQAWHLVTWTFVSRGRRGTYGTGLGLVARLGLLGCAGRRGTFAWQAWRLVTSTFVLRGRCGTL